MSLVYTEIASGNNQSHPLLLASPQTIYDAITGNAAAITQYVNQQITNAEAGLPEGERVELNIRGWTVPVLGSVGQGVADQVNQQWRAGKIKDLLTGERPLAWPEYPNQVAWYTLSNDTLTLRWRKGQPFVVWFVLAIIAIVVGQYLVGILGGILGNWFGTGKYGWSMWKAAPATPPNTPPPSTGMPLWEKTLLIGGGVLVVSGLIWFYAQLRLREAGANKSYQEIIIER